MSQNSNAEPVFYGRRKGKKLHTGRQDALDSVLPEVLIRLPGAVVGEKDCAPVWTTPPIQTNRARALRKSPTAAEQLFWQRVRSRQIDGYKFKRQFPVGQYVVDFICLEKNLVVEIDGGQHNENKNDEVRTKYLNSQGFEVVRFWNNDVLGNIDGTLEALTLALSRKREREHRQDCPSPRSHPPLQLAGEGWGEGPLIDPQSFFPFPVRDVQLEIGFGNGENLLYHALNNPDTGFIGCEPFINGVATLCKSIRDNKVNNIRLWPEDARLLMPKLASHSLGRVFVLNGDPWPKTRHWRRRFIQTETLDEISRLLKPGAQLRLSTDHPALAAWLIEKTYFHPKFEWMAQSAADWRVRPADMQETRYQKKGLQQGRPTVFLNLQNKGT